MNTRIICLSLQQNHINRREKMTNKVHSECTAEPTLLCTLLDIADDAEADTRQAADLSDAGAKVFQ